MLVLGKLLGKPLCILQMTRAEVIASLKEDYNNNYFVSGTGAMEAYEPDCEFADPFASFRGAPDCSRCILLSQIG